MARRWRGPVSVALLLDTPAQIEELVRIGLVCLHYLHEDSVILFFMSV